MPVSDKNFGFPWLRLAALLLGSRIWMVVVGTLFSLYAPRGEFYGTASKPIDFFCRWDAGWYSQIAREGYFRADGNTDQVAFFPGYPLAVRLLNSVFGDVRYAGATLSFVSFLVAGIMLYKVTRREFGVAFPQVDPSAADSRCLWAVALFAFGPVAFFFSAVYSEALFFALCLLAIDLGRRGRFIFAGLVGAAAALTRNAGVFLCVFLLVEMWSQGIFKRGTPKLWVSLLICCLPALGTLAYLLYLWSAFGDPFIMTKVQLNWSRRLSWPWEPFLPSHMQGFPPAYRVWFVSIGGAAIAGLLAGWKQSFSRSIWLFGALLFLLAISANHLESIPRYASVVLPLYLSVAFVKTPVVRWVILVVSLLAFTLTTGLFVNGFWMT